MCKEYIVGCDNIRFTQMTMARPTVAEERREQILAAFEACVVRQGLAETTLTDVAVEAGQPRSLVRYFIGNRDEMIACLLDRLLDRGEAQLNKAMAKHAELSPDDVAALLFDEVFADHTTNIVIMELWHLSIRDEALRRRLGALYRRLIDEVSSALPGAKTGDDRNEAFDAAFATVSLAFGASFFGQMGVKPKKLARIRAYNSAILRKRRPLPKPAKPEPNREGFDEGH